MVNTSQKTYTLNLDLNLEPQPSDSKLQPYLRTALHRNQTIDKHGASVTNTSFPKYGDSIPF